MGDPSSLPDPLRAAPSSTGIKESEILKIRLHDDAMVTPREVWCGSWITEGTGDLLDGYFLDL